MTDEIFENQDVVESNNSVIDEIKTELGRLPDLILNSGQNLLLKRKERDEIDLILKQHKSVMLKQVEEEYEDTKEKGLSTIAKRQAEAERRLDDSNDCNILKDKLLLLDQEIKELSLKLEFLNNRLKSSRALAMLLGGK